MMSPKLALPILALPLLALSVLLPGGLDTGIPAALAGALPLAWAAAVTIMSVGVDRITAASIALPFSAWAIATYGRSSDPAGFSLYALHLAASVAAYAAGVLWINLLEKRSGSMKKRNAIRSMAHYLAGSGPAIAIHVLAGPAYALPVAAFTASAAVFLRERGR